MNLEFFIARRIALGAKKSFSRFIIRVAVAAVALSLSVMIIAMATVTGFQKVISEKIYGFWGHIHITHFDANRSFEDMPVTNNQEFYPYQGDIPGVRHIQVYATKAGIIKTGTDIEGIVLKGVDRQFDFDNFKQFIQEGDALTFPEEGASKDIVISHTTAKRLNLKLGDDVIIYFTQKTTRARKLQVVGIYNTGLEEYDKLYALVDIAHIQRLNGWKEDQVGGFEVFLTNDDELEEQGDYIYYNVIGPDLYAQTIKEMYPNIFDWLQLQDLNETVILVLMIAVAVMNMVTALLILILERTRMVGILKALGATNMNVQKIFLYNAAYIVGVGLFWGNVIGIGLCLIQMYTHIVTLPEESYYVKYAPINFDWFFIIFLNLGTLLTCVLFLVLPTFLVTNIKPIKAIRWE